MFSPLQQKVIQSPLNSKIFLRGPAGTGKTTAAVGRMQYLLENNIPSDQVLILAPQRTLQTPYLDLIHSPELLASGEIIPATIGGLARRTVDLFWPLAGEKAGFVHPDQPPVFLTLETAQYYIAALVRPHLDEGWFDSVVMDRNRLCSQILDNLNKSALTGFPYQEIGERLSAAWSGDRVQLRVYQDAQNCATEFRSYCLENNLLDISLQMEIFSQILWNDSTVRNYLTRTYRHLIYDNIEEDVPIAHDILSEWLPDFDSALIIFDENAGYRMFLGADPVSASFLETLSDETIEFVDSYVSTPGIRYLSDSLGNSFELANSQNVVPVRPNPLEENLAIISSRFYPDLLDQTAREVKRLIDEENVDPAEIAILFPYLGDSVRFSIMSRMEALGIPVRSHRPSRSLRDEAAVRSLLTLAALAHPQWKIIPEKYDVCNSFVQSIENMDLIRARLLTDIVYRTKDFSLSPFEIIEPKVQERLTAVFGGKYIQIREWIETYKKEDPLPLDHFLRRLFGEVLSQPGFGFHSDDDATTIAANLIESVQKFRWAMEPTVKQEQPVDIGKEYVTMLEEGVIAAQFLSAWAPADGNAVFIAPAYTFLMSNSPVRFQFWLDIGSSGWYERLSQPLTHPFVLSRQWTAGRIWTDEDETGANNAAIARLVKGLLCRCREKIYLGVTDLSESGYEQRGPLMRAFHKIYLAK